MICDIGDVFWLWNLILGEEKFFFFFIDGEYKLINKLIYLLIKMEILIVFLDSVCKFYYNIMLWFRKVIV